MREMKTRGKTNALDFLRILDPPLEPTYARFKVHLLPLVSRAETAMSDFEASENNTEQREK